MPPWRNDTDAEQASRIGGGPPETGPRHAEVGTLRTKMITDIQALLLGERS